jgi:hypothetical protein
MDHRNELVEVISGVRNRWRQRLALRGAVVVVAGTVLALLLFASGLESLRFAASAIIAFRVIAFAVFIGLVAYAFVRPLRRRVTDSQVAMYLEESNPQLEAAIISAIEATRLAESGDSPHSPRLVEKLVEQAVEQCRALDDRRSADSVAFRRHALTLGGIAAVTVAIVTLGPAYLRHGISALLVVSRSAEASSPYRIEVTPGNAKVPRGADQAVRAKLIGFSSKDVGVMMRTSPAAAFDRLPLVPSASPSSPAGTNAAASEAGVFEGMLFHLDKATEYYVESNGVRSPTFSLAVVDLPTVQQLDLEYHFPAYTNLPPRKVDGGGDVAAIRGTDVALRVTPTMKAPGGRILMNDGAAMPLDVQPDGTLTGRFAIKQQGFYRIELTGPHGEKVDASPQYTIDVIDDQAPSVRFTKPGRDTQASPVEELFLEARADDDYGVKQLQLFYSANGAAPKSVTLFNGPRPLQEVSAGHTIYLEELNLKAGDFVSYYAKATDTDAIQGPKTATSDIYFVQIRPFRKDYKPSQSQAMAGMGGAGGQQNSVGGLSQQQREIVAATFNAVRDKAKTKPDKYRENIVFLNLAQAKLREQVEELVAKLESRLGHVDQGFNKIAELLPKAATEMKTAEGSLKTLKADDALSPEQKALKLLQEAEQQYEVQVAMQNGGGGGGGGQNAMAEDLADLFELELDKLANQYEMQQRAEQQGNDRQIDELVEKLKELARRQQQEIERQRRLAQASTAGGSGGANQRQLADELEKAARQLQRLTRDQPRPDVADAMRRMQDAADAMRRAAANGSGDGGAQATEALARLREAQQKLERNQSGRGDRDLQRAQRQAEELAGEQKEIASEVNNLDQAGAGRAAKAQSLAQRKDAMDAKVADLQKQLEELANQMRRDEHDASRKLDEAANSIRDKKIREMLKYSKNTLSNGGSQYARGMEETLGTNLDALAKKVGEAGAAMGKQAKQDAVARAAEKARDLVRGMESLDQRMRDRAQQGSKASQGSQGSKSSQSSQGSESSAGSPSNQSSPSSSGSQGGQQGQDGQNRGGATNGLGPNAPRAGGAYGGDARNWGGWYGGYGYWNPDDVRQFRRDFREWANDAEALRRQLQASGLNPRELDDIIRDLTRFDNDRLYADPKGLELLQASALDKLKKFEFALRRKADQAGNDSLTLSGSDQVPDSFRQAIEEYYRSLAKRQAPQR